MNLYISDLHFGQKNVILFEHRPFSDVDTMDHGRPFQVLCKR